MKRFQWTVNSQKNKTIGCCPNDVVFRYKLRNSLDNKLLAALYETEQDETTDTPALDEIARATDIEKAKWKARFDQHHRAPTIYAVGDLELVENVAAATGQSRKLEPKYKGPYVIKEVLDCDRYLVGDLDDIQRNQRRFLSVFSSEKIKSWCSLGPEASTSTGSDDEEEEPDKATPPETAGAAVRQERPNCQALKTAASVVDHFK